MRKRWFESSRSWKEKPPALPQAAHLPEKAKTGLLRYLHPALRILLRIAVALIAIIALRIGLRRLAPGDPASDRRLRIRLLHIGNCLLLDLPVGQLGEGLTDPHLGLRFRWRDSGLCDLCGRGHRRIGVEHNALRPFLL